MRIPANPRSQSFFTAALSALLALGVTSCGPEVKPTPARLRIGLVAYENQEQVAARYRPLLSYLQAEVGLPVELLFAKSYADQLTDFVEGRTDLARFGAVALFQARDLTDTIPLVVRASDRHSTTLFLTRENDPRQTLADFRKARFTFGARSSVSGHLIPRHFLEEQGIEPEGFFSGVDYTSGHDQVAFQVRDGAVDLGAANASVIAMMLDTDRLQPGTLRIVAETLPQPAFCWAASGRLPDDLQRTIRDAFLALSPNNSGHQSVIKETGGDYLPVSMDDFSEMEPMVRNAAARGLLPR